MSALWSAVICHRFNSFGDSSPKQSRVQRLAEETGHSLAFDGDKSPAESAAKAAHSKAFGVRTNAGTPLVTLALRTRT